MVQNFQVMQSIFAATKLGIPNLIGDGHKSCDELADATAFLSDSATCIAEQDPNFPNYPSKIKNNWQGNEIWDELMKFEFKGNH